MRTHHPACSLLLATITCATIMGAAGAGIADAGDAPQLHVHAGGRYLSRDDGSPFFWLGDTAWELFHRLDRSETDLYLADRAAKGFTVIQAVVLAEYGGLTVPDASGHLPLTDNDPTKPVEAYFQDVDYAVDKAASLGLWIGMLPTWGDKWNKAWGQGPEIFTAENAGIYGEFLGRRYRDKPVIWILGGDRPMEEKHRGIINAMAEGLRRGDGGRHLITFHPSGQQHSSQYFQATPWLDFNMVQTGHTFDRDNFRDIAHDYALMLAKPTLDGEPGYEDHPSGFKAANGYMTDRDARRFAYWAVFSGACGHTYGCHDIWQFLAPGRTPVTAARTPWREAINLPGAAQVGYLRALVESRPYFTRIPDQGLLQDGPPSPAAHVAVTSDRDAQGHATMIMAYLPTSAPATFATSGIRDAELTAWWFDPRSGTATASATVPNSGTYTTGAPPCAGDWVVVLEAPSAGYRPPGTVSWRH
jgi:hypothetical protein